MSNDTHHHLCHTCDSTDEIFIVKHRNRYRHPQCTYCTYCSQEDAWADDFWGCYIIGFFVFVLFFVVVLLAAGSSACTGCYNTSVSCCC